MDHEDRTQLCTLKTVETFGKYILLKKLAEGGMAEVFLARPASSDGNGRVQVVKRILPHIANNAVFLDMFRSEIQVIMGFNHPHTVQLHDFGDCGRQPFIAMEYIEGKSLKEVLGKFLQQKERIPVPMALGLVAQAAAGLSYAHTFVNKVTDEAVHAIHRDISPHNLMVTYEGNLKVIDFGIAKATIGMKEATRTGTIKGKMAYLSPEQISGQPVDARTDVFALGIVAWELLTMRRAFITEGDSEVTVVSRIENCETYIPAPSTLNPEIPSEVDEVIMKAMRKNPNDRYASAKDFQVALRKVMQNFFPNYSYADTGQRLSSLFSVEIEIERKELRDLNVMAQMELVNRSVGVPRFVPERTHAVSTPHAGLMGGAAGKQEAVNDRLVKIESLMKQNASTRHYVWMAMYLVAAIAIRLEGRYSIFNYLIPVPEVNISQETVASNSARAVVPVRPQNQLSASALQPQSQTNLHAHQMPPHQGGVVRTHQANAQASANSGITADSVRVSSENPNKPVQVRPTQIHAAQLLIKAVGTKSMAGGKANSNLSAPTQNRQLLSSAEIAAGRTMTAETAKTPTGKILRTGSRVPASKTTSAKASSKTHAKLSGATAKVTPTK